MFHNHCYTRNFLFPHPCYIKPIKAQFDVASADNTIINQTLIAARQSVSERVVNRLSEAVESHCPLLTQPAVCT